MSRIAGLITTDVSHHRDGLVANMLEAIEPRPGWRQQRCSACGVAMGWTGWRTPNVAQRLGIVAVVDGVFYNRADLDAGRHDADRLISLYWRHGFSGALKRINGDFAVALYDTREQTLWLGRDRVGAKPLYYFPVGSGIAFGSRMRSLLTLPDSRAEVDPRWVSVFAASHYRYFDNDPEATPFTGVRQLPAATALKWAGGRLHTERYWELSEQDDWEGSEAELAERYRDLLMDATRIRLDHARAPGFTLSGGMDSSSVLSCAVRESGRKQHAFSTVYEDKTYDESSEIATILDETVSQWHTVPLGTPDVVATVREMVRAHDEPVATATWLSHYLLCRQASAEKFGTLFGGLGGDELNAGEYEYFFYHFADLQAAGKQEQLNHEIEKWIEYHDHPIFKKSHQLVRDELAKVLDPSRPGVIRPETRRMARYHDALDAGYYPLGSFAPAMDHPFKSYLKNRTFQDIFRETAPCCLRAEDRQATWFELENCLPFFDHRLIEFMYRVPGELKIRDGVTKVLLRQAMEGVLPDETRNRIAKTGWNAPAHVWFSGAGRETLMDLIHSQAFRERGVYNVPRVLELAEEHETIMSGNLVQENHMMFLWQLVNLELWFQEVDSWAAVDRAARLHAAAS